MVGPVLLIGTLLMVGPVLLIYTLLMVVPVLLIDTLLMVCPVLLIDMLLMVGPVLLIDMQLMVGPVLLIDTLLMVGPVLLIDTLLMVVPVGRRTIPACDHDLGAVLVDSQTVEGALQHGVMHSVTRGLCGHCKHTQQAYYSAYIYSLKHTMLHSRAAS